MRKYWLLKDELPQWSGFVFVTLYWFFPTESSLFIPHSPILEEGSPRRSTSGVFVSSPGYGELRTNTRIQQFSVKKPHEHWNSPQSRIKRSRKHSCHIFTWSSYTSLSLFLFLAMTRFFSTELAVVLWVFVSPDVVTISWIGVRIDRMHG